MPAKPMLDDVELQQVQTIASRDEAAVEPHGVPALEGDFLQDLGRRSVRVELTGMLTGAGAAEGLKKLREKFRTLEPVSFVSDIATATVVDKVLIGELQVEEVAGTPQRFEYAVALLEFVEPPKPKTEPPPPPPPPPPPKVDQGTLEVEVVVEGQPGFDHGRTITTADGTTDSGQSLTRTLTDRKDNVWRDETIAPGSFTVKAVVMTPQVLSGTAPAKIQAGQTTKVTITLAPGGVVATEFVVHFRFDKAFVEPCMRKALEQAAKFATANPTQKLLIAGHTDLVGTPATPTGPDPYNQSLSERRARAVHAFLTFGRDAAAEEAAVAEWTALRQKQTGPASKPTLADNWGTRQYQHMLQDLGFYPGPVDGKEGKLTQEAVRAFRCQSGLPPGTVIDDAAWDKLIRAYLRQDSFKVPDSQFFRNCGAEPLKWVGCASQDPVKNTRQAHRPNRRVELLFVNDTKVPCEVPPPDTFDLPAPGAVGSDWCVGPGDNSKRACFTVPHLPKDGKPKGKEWTRTPAEPGTVDVKVSIKKEVVDAAGNVTLKAAGSQPFVLITSDGEFKAGEQSTGEPTPAATGADGTKTFTGKFPGIHSVEVITPPGKPVLVQLDGSSGATALGNAVCKHLTLDNATIEVVILREPVLRQVRLPTSVHLLRALHPLTRELRTCPLVGGKPGETFTQKTQRDAANVRKIFELANEVWRQGRVRFDVVDIVEEFYSFSVACEVTNGEIGTLLERCAYPNTVNVFFVADLDGAGEAGGAVSMETAAAAGIPGGAFVGDRFQFTLLIEQDKELGETRSRQVLAHELGHFLTLAHTSDDSANKDRLMFANTGFDGSNIRLIPDEVTQARASLGAHFECVPLSLKVTGATRLGGTRSHEFLVIQDPAVVVTVDAEISPELLAEGAVVMTGGTAGASDLQRTVSAAAAGPAADVVATYTPNGGGDVVTTRASIQVSTFQLRATGNGVRVVNPTTAAAPLGAAGQLVTIDADLIPAPFCFPKDAIQWTNGTGATDPLRRTVAQDATGATAVTARVAGVSRTLTISVFEVVLVSHRAPLGPAVATALIEGLPNHTLGGVDLTTLAGAQPDSLFRVRATVPTVPGTTLQAALRHTAPDGSVQNVPLTLTKSGDAFVSLPILAVPASIPANAITLKQPKTLDVARAQRGGRIQCTVPVLGGVVSNEITVRMRAVFLFVQTLTDADNSDADLKATGADVRRQIARANAIWNPQSGIEIRERSFQVVADPGGLIEIDTVAVGLSTDEKKLIGQLPGGPVQSATRTDINVYYVKAIKGRANGETFPGLAITAMEGPAATDSALAHEIGHHLLFAHWTSPASRSSDDKPTKAGDDHIDLAGTPWPESNVMHQFDAGGGQVDRTQVGAILPARGSAVDQVLAS